MRAPGRGARPNLQNHGTANSNTNGTSRAVLYMQRICTDMIRYEFCICETCRTTVNSFKRHQPANTKDECKTQTSRAELQVRVTSISLYIIIEIEENSCTTTYSSCPSFFFPRGFAFSIFPRIFQLACSTLLPGWVYLCDIVALRVRNS